MSEHPSDLAALSVDGRWVTGETSVDEMEEDLLRLDLSPEVPATKEGVLLLSKLIVSYLAQAAF